MSDITKKNTGAVAGPRSAVLDRIRAAKPAKPQAGTPAAPVPARRPRLVFSVDATASRQETWESAKRITDRMFDAIPGALDVALAVHGGDQLHTFTEFSADARRFRTQAAAVRCQSGHTVICELMQRTLDAGGVRVMSYIGDAFEEVAEDAYALADRFKLRGIKAVILADNADDGALQVFREIAARTGGALLDFRGADLGLMGEILGAIATLAIGGRRLLEAKRTPGAKLLLAHLGD